jgi:hypothetical protein
MASPGNSGGAPGVPMVQSAPRGKCPQFVIERSSWARCVFARACLYLAHRIYRHSCTLQQGFSPGKVGCGFALPCRFSNRSGVGAMSQTLNHLLPPFRPIPRGLSIVIQLVRSIPIHVRSSTPFRHDAHRSSWQAVRNRSTPPCLEVIDIEQSRRLRRDDTPEPPPCDSRGSWRTSLPFTESWSNAYNCAGAA